ncbi:hypothetical protein NZK35_05560 [Stieleria sp. ICT_E10.1]|uniref:hypothetical protein n=1 Tax=Stieleria sedimenti TaxID=2976331 RepID=UPI00217F88AC|nr:hypothetical protein [Stieleria sedimenti]MCS7466140.1 hypothetical protein [Stieleria sedimenti]
MRQKTSDLTFIIDQRVIAEITGLSTGSVRQHQANGALRLEDARSVIPFVVRHSDPLLKASVINALAETNGGLKRLLYRHTYEVRRRRFLHR